MKRICLLSIISFLISAVSIITQAQEPYSVENLEQASQEELNIYLEKALKLQKSGKTVTIIGGAAVVLGAGWALVDPLKHGLGAVEEGGIMILAGLGTMAVGIPMNITGKKRVERINSIRNTVYNKIIIDLKPYSQYNLMTQNYQLGVMLGIRF